ncbi:Hpt domain-containing protein [Phreatobacter aquaticus]|uniref:Hpt domain-containing protein n=1 Tax=Phreatobacter aquaticus TaxID=2570229 RepID=A0A4D7QGW1_9HYPH|nr:Hpt domain-containing protein [Phreatobacter aquaticus]QCK87070.1 Hpt domain-containing protein [Phreatobacter aquaticus]
MSKSPGAKRPTKKLDEADVKGFLDHEVITPSHTLRNFARKMDTGDDSSGGIDFDAIERAEAALAELSSEFDSWMDMEVARLVAARDDAANGMTAAIRAAVYTASHDIKGEAATFGYPLAGHIADSLCGLLDGIPETDRVPVSLVLQHVDAIRAIVRESAKGDNHPIALALRDRLVSVTSDALVALTGSPPLAPS